MSVLGELTLGFGGCCVIATRTPERCPDVKVEGDEGATLMCAPSHVSHVFMELMKNALNATAVAMANNNAVCTSHAPNT